MSSALDVYEELWVAYLIVNARMHSSSGCGSCSPEGSSMSC